MDKQQAACEFEEWHKNEYGSGPCVAPITYGERNAWQASREALMPALVEARDALAFYGSNPNSYPDGGDYANKALARINAILGENE